MQAVSIAAYMIFTRMPPVNMGVLKRIYAAAVLCGGIFPAVLASAGYIRSFPTLYASIIAAAALSAFLASFRAVAEFNMTPRLFSRSLYGATSGKAAVIGGALTICISAYAGFAIRQDSADSYAFLFRVPLAALLISAVFVLLYKFDSGEAAEPPLQISYLEVIKKAASARYLIKLSPHFLRGVGMAGMYYIIPSALENISLSDGERSFLIVISVASTMTGSFLFMFLTDKVSSGTTAFLSILACSVLMPFLVVCTDKYLFFWLYFIFFICNIITQISIPTGVLRSTPDDELSLITSMRLMLMSVAASLFIFIFGVLLKHISPVYIMIFSSMVFTFCGFLYERQFDDRL
jgi:hypothetical protein